MADFDDDTLRDLEFTPDEALIEGVGAGEDLARDLARWCEERLGAVFKAAAQTRGIDGLDVVRRAVASLFRTMADGIDSVPLVPGDDDMVDR